METLKYRWKNLRDGMMKCLKKQTDYHKSGRGAGKLPTCKCFDQLLFLKDSISNKTKTTSNLSEETTQQSSNPDIVRQVSNQTCSTLSKQSENLEERNPIPENSFLSVPSECADEIDEETFSKPSKLKRREKQRKSEDRRDSIDALLIKTLSNYDPPQNTTIMKEESSNMLFCKSLAPLLEKLPRKKNLTARLKMQQVLLDLDSDDD